MARYTVGQVVAITSTFTDVPGVAGVPGALIDPGTVVFTVQPPNSPSVTPVVTHVSLGIYRVLVSLDNPGQYFYKWTSTNNAQGVGQGAYENDFFATATKI